MSDLPVTAETTERAQLRAEESFERAKRAHRAMSERHADAGKWHR